MSRLPAFMQAPRAVPDTAAKGQVRCGSFALAQQGAPWKFGLLHDRPDNVLLWITRGQGRVTVGGVRRGISMNNALYLPAGTLFSIDLPVGVQALYVESTAGLTGRLPRAPLLLRVRDSLAQAELTGEVDAMRREISRNRAHLQEALEAHVRLIAVWLRRQIADGVADQPQDSAAVRLVRRYAQAVLRDFRKAKPMAAYAEALDVTPAHLTRVCKLCCGKTAADILAERKLHAARMALCDAGPAVQEIARALGFVSPASFTRFVQNHSGQTPSALRAEARHIADAMAKGDATSGR